jgi:hypothetical protein
MATNKAGMKALRLFLTQQNVPVFGEKIEHSNDRTAELIKAFEQLRR